MKKYKKPLRCVSINEDTYNKLLNCKSNKNKQYSANLDEYEYGYTNKLMTYYNEKALICSHLDFVYLGIEEELDDYKSCWMQVYCQVNYEQTENVSSAVHPAQASKIINNIIKKHYTEDEKIEVFHNHEIEDSTILKESILTPVAHTLHKYTNCYYYDANGAYASELISLFPKCKDDFKYMFEHRHDNNNKFKNVFNFYVGQLTQNEKKLKDGAKPRVIYPKTRHYIVNNITNKVNNLLNELIPELRLYVNTDGFIIKNPLNIKDSSKDIGEFKIEYTGDVYTYRDKNYSIIQYGDEIKGSMPRSIRHLVDLRKGITVEYDLVEMEDGHKEPINIKQKEITNYATNQQN